MAHCRSRPSQVLGKEKRRFSRRSRGSLAYLRYLPYLHRLILASLLLLAGSRPDAAAQDFVLGFDGPDSLCGAEGTVQESPFACTLTTPEAPLVRGWSLSIAAVDASITSVTSAGTTAESLFRAEFEMHAITTGPGNEGAVSTVILSTDSPVTLPPNSTSSLAFIGVEAGIAADVVPATLRYQDGLEGAGKPVPNVLSDETGTTILPVKTSHSFDLVPDTLGECDAVNPNGWIRTAAWNMMLPLGNPAGCGAGGANNMLRNWVTPRDAVKSTPTPGAEWPDVDFQGTAVASGFEADAFFAALGFSGDPIWITTDFARESFDLAVPNRDRMSFQDVVDAMNAQVTPGISLPRVFADNVFAIAHTYVENTSGAPVCVNVCTSSSDSLQVWVNQQLITNISTCRDLQVVCNEKMPAALQPGLNKISVLCWDGSGEWGFKLGLEDAGTGELLSNANQDQIVFRGGAIDDARPPDQLVVRRTANNQDSCPADFVRVTLSGTGAGQGSALLEERFSAREVTAASFLEISDNGVLTQIDEGGVPVEYVITWDISVDVLTSSGVFYELDLTAGNTVQPSGMLNSCVAVVGLGAVDGRRVGAGAQGVFESGHDIGSAADLQSGGGSVLYGAGADGTPSTLDDVFILEGSGVDIGDNGDSFHYAYRRVKGNFSIRTRIMNRVFPPDGGGQHDRYGLMVRRDCTVNSSYSMVYAQLEESAPPQANRLPGEAVFFQFRRSHLSDGPNDSSQSFEFPDPDGEGPLLANQPNHLRLDRLGDLIYGYASIDGVDWKLIGVNTWEDLAPDAELLVGIAYSKGRETPTAGFVTFTDVEIERLVTPGFINNDAASSPTIVYQSDFAALANGPLPPGLIGNTRGAGDGGGLGGLGRGAAGGAFTPQVVDGRIRLTEEGRTDTATSVFLDQDVTLSGELTIDFTVHLTHSGVQGQPVTGDPNPGEGMTLIVLAGTETDVVGDAGGGLGYRGITGSFPKAVPSLAVEIDTWTNDFFNEGTGSTSNDGTWHLGINSGASTESVKIKNSNLPDVFDPNGVPFRVVIGPEGRVSVFVVTDDGGGAGGLEFTLLADALIGSLSSEGHSVGRVGLTAATGPVGSQTTEVSSICVTQLECSDNPEEAVIQGPTTADIGQTVVLDGSMSTTGAGDADETLSYQWEVTGAGEMSGPDDGVNVAIIVGDGEAIARLTVNDGNCSNPSTITHSIVSTGGAPNWTTYDANNDGSLNIADPIFDLNFLFGGGLAPECEPAMDFNGDNGHNIADPIAALNFLFGGGIPPAAGEGCSRYAGCGMGVGC